MYILQHLRLLYQLDKVDKLALEQRNCAWDEDCTSTQR